MNFLIKNYIYNFILVRRIFCLFFFYSFFKLSFYLFFNINIISFFFFYFICIFWPPIDPSNRKLTYNNETYIHTMRRMVWIVKPLCKSHDIRIDTSCTARVTVSCLLSITKLLESLILNILILKIAYYIYSWSNYIIYQIIYIIYQINLQNIILSC